VIHAPPFMLLASCSAIALGIAGCEPSSDTAEWADYEIEASLADAAPTVVRVEWTTDEPVQGMVSFGETDAYGWETPLEDAPSTEHTALLLGMPHSTEIHFAVVSQSDAGSERSADHSIVTGGVPAILPSISIDLGERSPSAFTAIPVVADIADDEQQAVAIMDDQGRWVWATELEPGYQSLRVRLAPDGGGVVYNAVASDKESDLPSKLIQVGWDGEPILELDTPDLHHDFVLLPDGGFAYLGTEPRPVGDVTMGSDIIVAIDSSGASQVVWTLWDHIEDDFGMVIDPENLDPSESLGHANNLQFVEDQDAWLVDFANLGSVAQIDRASGQPSWILGGTGDSFDASPDPPPAFRAHEIQLEGDSLWMFVNDLQGDECSRLWKVGLDIENRQAAVEAEYHWDPCQYTYAMGGVNRLPLDHTLIVWSLAGRLEVLDSELTPVWAAQASLGAGFGYTSSTDSLY